MPAFKVGVGRTAAGISSAQIHLQPTCANVVTCDYGHRENDIMYGIVALQHTLLLLKV